MYRKEEPFFLLVFGWCCQQQYKQCWQSHIVLFKCKKQVSFPHAWCQVSHPAQEPPTQTRWSLAPASSSQDASGPAWAELPCTFAFITDRGNRERWEGWKGPPVCSYLFLQLKFLNCKEIPLENWLCCWLETYLVLGAPGSRPPRFCPKLSAQTF